MTEKTDLHASSATQTADVQPIPQDSYATVTLSENSLISADTLAAFKQTAAQVQLPAESLQKWISYEENRLQMLAQEAEKKQREKIENWAHQTQEAFGSQWQEEVSKAVRAADAFGGTQLRQLLEETGLGNHPVIVRTFHAVARQICEDITPGGAPSATTDKTFTQALYGKN